MRLLDFQAFKGSWKIVELLFPEDFNDRFFGGLYFDAGWLHNRGNEVVLFCSKFGHGLASLEFVENVLELILVVGFFSPVLHLAGSAVAMSSYFHILFLGGLVRKYYISRYPLWLDVVEFMLGFFLFHLLDHRPSGSTAFWHHPFVHYYK